ncbi:30S ribosomal protein S8 [Rickettsiales bacterium (ex Bugula neritina AB1)]|nr:30S ribosomal protein S8 [Rickettsiales bacterium (ex Bugula neritina AB1)]
MITSLTANAITSIRNGYTRKLKTVYLPYSKLILGIVKILKEEGYIEDFYEENLDNKKFFILVKLRYFSKNLPAIKKISIVSKPGQRIYINRRKIPWVYNGFGISIISTNKGLLSSFKASQLRVGGELILKVF